MRIFIGFDPRETVAFHVAAQSIMDHASVPVSITPIQLNHYDMAKDPRASTEFSITRFLTPRLAGYKGQALFMDCDMLVRCDIKELFDLCGYDKDVYVVKHDYEPKEGAKFLGAEQHAYPRKNWSSVMLFNCSNAACKRLTDDFVDMSTPSVLHQFKWCQDERIGELGPEWNHLVGEYAPNPDAKIVHFTRGTPCFKGFGRQEYAREWRETLKQANYAED